jgi:hypothetical protein
MKKPIRVYAKDDWARSLAIHTPMADSAAIQTIATKAASKEHAPNKYGLKMDNLNYASQRSA